MIAQTYLMLKSILLNIAHLHFPAQVCYKVLFFRRSTALFISLSRVSLLFLMLVFVVSNKKLMCSWLQGPWKVANSSILALNSSASTGNRENSLVITFYFFFDTKHHFITDSEGHRLQKLKPSSQTALSVLNTQASQ